VAKGVATHPLVDPGITDGLFDRSVDDGVVEMVAADGSVPGIGAAGSGGEDVLPAPIGVCAGELPIESCRKKNGPVAVTEILLVDFADN
jgi:hypothetical protein